MALILFFPSTIPQFLSLNKLLNSQDFKISLYIIHFNNIQRKDLFNNYQFIYLNCYKLSLLFNLNFFKKKNFENLSKEITLLMLDTWNLI